MIAKVTRADSKLIDLPQELCERLLKQSEVFSLEEIFSAFNILVNTQEMAKRLESLRIPLEISLVRLAHSKKGSDLKGLANIKEAPAKEKILPENPKDKEGDDVKDSGNPVQTVSLDSIKENWHTIINNLEKIKMSVATYLSGGEPTKIEGKVLNVSFPRDHSLHKESLERRENKEIIEKCISELFNTNLRLNFILSQDLKHKPDNENIPFIRSALDVFKGRVIKEE
jgi:DNA polymerase-3 subunit gamma/tau